MENSKIEWCHHTINLWWGCAEVHEGCDNCYARIFAHRYGHEVWGNKVARREIGSWEESLLKLQRKAARRNTIERVFVGSMMDIFERPKPVMQSEKIADYTTGHIRSRFFKLTEQCPNLQFLLLTKRPSNINKYIPKDWVKTPPLNVVYGTSVVNQKTADKLVPQLLEVTGRRFLSCEPLLDAINLKSYLSKIDWVIVGGESGHYRRPFDPEWGRKILSECKAKGVPFFGKQWDKKRELPKDLLTRQFPIAIDNKLKN